MAVIGSAPGSKGNPPSGARSGTLKQQRQALRTYQTEEYGLASTTATTSLLWTQIRTNGGTQMRAGLNQETVGEYADVMRHNNSYEPFPALTVFYDGETYWLADGFHRHRAAYEAFGSGCTVPVDVRTGTRRDAVLYAAQANAKHGLRRTNADKQRAVDTLLQDEEWSQWSDNEIARRCAVSVPFVSKRRSLLTVNSETKAATTQPRVYTTKHGTTATMQTAQIGKRESQERTDKTVAQLERLPTYLEDAGCTLTRLIDGTLQAAISNQQRIFSSNDISNAIVWLDTVVRATHATQIRKANSIIMLIKRSLSDLSEAHKIATTHKASAADRLAKMIETARAIIKELDGGDSGVLSPAVEDKKEERRSK